MRHLILAAAFVLGLAAPLAAQETRLFIDDAGHEVTIPIKPQRIVSLREEQFTAPLVELGANLVGSSGLVNENVEGGKPYARGAYDALDFRFEGSGVTFVGSPNQHDYEAITAVSPDLIIIPEFAADDYDKLSLIAPTIVLQVWGQNMLDMYRKVADVSDTLPKFEQMLARYEERAERGRATLAETIGDPAKVSIALASAGTDGTLSVYRDYAALSQVLRDLGFAMPKLIADQVEGNSKISVELIEQIDADFMINTYWTANDQSPRQQSEAFDTMLPTWRELLHFGRHNQVFQVNREEMRAVSFAALRSIMEIVISQVATRDFVPLGADQ